MIKNFVLASALAVASVLSIAPQSQAASVTVTTTDAPPPPRFVQERHHDRHYRSGPRHGCVVKQVKTYRHGAVVYRESKVCR